MGLCQLCSRLDLDSLILPPPAACSYDAADDIAAARKVIRPLFSASSTPSCALCDLVETCFQLAETPSLRVGLQCCIQPAFVWQRRPPATESTLEHSGCLNVNFFKEVAAAKDERYRDLPDSSSSTRNALSALRSRLKRRIAPSRSTDLAADSESQDQASPAGRGLVVPENVSSWTIDITHSSNEGSGTSRLPIGSSVDVSLLSAWLSQCRHEHNHVARLPGTTTSLGDLPLKASLRAINTASGLVSLLDPGHKFATLSYVWGESSLPMSAFSDWQARFRSSRVPNQPTVEAYPPTIRDAILLARTLGLDWIWVDRICIDQNDQREKALIVPYMKDIFAASEVTIVAGSGHGTDAGLPGVGLTRRAGEKIFDIEWRHNQMQLVPGVQSFNSMLEGSLWRTRGWTFEEYIFSRRLIYIFPNEVFFCCARGTCRESTGKHLDPQSAGSSWGERGKTPPTITAELHAKLHSSLPGLEKTLTAREMVRAVEEYSARGLTVEEDRIKAFAGVIAAANVAANAIQDESLLLHGHPLRFCETLLTWHHELDSSDEETGNQKPHARLWSKRCKIHRNVPSTGNPIAPSWSWASAHSKVHFLDTGEEHIRCEWFRFTQLRGFDVLAVPVSGKSFSYHDQHGISYPTQIVKDEPWNVASVESLPAYQKQTEAAPAHGAAPSLPVLHLVTLVFDAMFARKSADQHLMYALDHDPTTRLQLLGHWSIIEGDFAAATPRPTSDESPDEEPRKTIRGLRCVFAIIGGGPAHMYIMLLKPATESGVYSRQGLFRVSLSFLSQPPPIGPIMAKGMSRWEHIRLI